MRSLRLPTKRSQWKNQFTTIESASKLHNHIRHIFANDSFFRRMNCFQEVPVSALVPSYFNNSHRVDWFVDELMAVVEVHGRQHYKMQNFGNKPYMEALKDFNNGRYRDNIKKTALLDADYVYVEIPFNLVKKMDGPSLKDLILTCALGE